MTYNLIHFINPNNDLTFCRASGVDVRAFGFKCRADEACPVCWERRRRYRTEQALKRGVTSGRKPWKDRQLDKKRRIEEKELERLEAAAAKDNRPTQYDLL